MAVTNEFTEAVQAGDVLLVRIMLKDSLLVDPTAAQFDEMEQYAKGKIPNIYMEHDGEALSFDVTVWNESYLNAQMVAVVSNFSRERIDLLKSMVRHLYPAKVCKLQSERDSASKSRVSTRKQVGIGVAVAGAVVAATGLVTSHMVLTIGGAVAAAAGVAILVSDKGNV